MKQKGHLLGILFTVVVAFSARGGAKAVDMKFATSKDTFIKGEPIIITCTLSNLSTNVITLDLGYDRVQGFLFAVEGSQLLTNPAAYGGLSSPPKVELQPGATHREFLVLDEWSLPLKNGSNSLTACLYYNGTKLTNVFAVKLVEPAGNDLEVALGALIARAATTADGEERVSLERGLHLAAGQSPRVRAFLNRQERELKSIIENIDREIGD